MPIEDSLREAAQKLESGHLANEAQVKQAVILPILRNLGWDDTDPLSFKPEFSVENGSVDYALLDHGRPIAFLEAKRTGALSARGEDQLFRYATNRGVPILILTDGNQWDFYLSMAAGAPSERRIFTLELKTHDRIPEHAAFFDSILRKTHVLSGKARRYAERWLERNRNRARARRAIPAAWNELVKGRDDILFELLTEAVAQSSGTTPDPGDIDDFLSKLAIPTQEEPIAGRRTPKQSEIKTKRLSRTPRAKTKIVGFTLGSESVQTGSAIGTLIGLVKRFAKSDPTFMNRYASKTVGRTRKLVARDRNELFAEARLVELHAKDLGNGWWLGGNLSQDSIRKKVETACKVANMQLGSHVKFIEQDQTTQD